MKECVVDELIKLVRNTEESYQKTWRELKTLKKLLDELRDKLLKELSK